MLSDFNPEEAKRKYEESIKNPFRDVTFTSVEELQEKMAESWDKYILDREIRRLRDTVNVVFTNGIMQIILGIMDEQNDKLIPGIIINMLRCEKVVGKIKTLADLDEARLKISKALIENSIQMPLQSETISMCGMYAEVLERMNLQFVADLKKPELQERIDEVLEQLDTEIKEFFKKNMPEDLQESAIKDKFDELASKFLAKKEKKEDKLGWDDEDEVVDSDKWKDLL
jgi:hypothetical protein